MRVHWAGVAYDEAASERSDLLAFAADAARACLLPHPQALELAHALEPCVHRVFIAETQREASCQGMADKIDASWTCLCGGQGGRGGGKREKESKSEGRERKRVRAREERERE